MKKLLVVALSVVILLMSISVSAALPNLSDAFKDPLKQAAGDSGAGFRTNVDFMVMISIVIRTALSILGIVFLILMIYGGYLWMNARGDEEHVKKAQHLISAAIIGLIIVVGAYAISFFIISRLGKDVLTSGSPAGTGGSGQGTGSGRECAEYDSVDGVTCLRYK